MTTKIRKQKPFSESPAKRKHLAAQRLTQLLGGAVSIVFNPSIEDSDPLKPHAAAASRGHLYMVTIRDANQFDDMPHEFTIDDRMAPTLAKAFANELDRLATQYSDWAAKLKSIK